MISGPASLKVFLRFCLAYFFLVPIFFLAFPNSDFTDIEQPASNSTDYAVITSGCRFPLHNHSAWSVAYRKRSGRNNSCRGKELFVHFSKSNIPVLNAQRLLATHGVTPEALTCYYSNVSRASNAAVPDEGVEFSSQRLLSFGTKLYEDGVRITCMKDGATLFTEYHMVPQEKKLRVQDLRSLDDILEMVAAHRQKLSVLVVGVDSVSRLNAVRHLRRSRRYLLQRLNAYELLAFNGIGDGFKSQLALLTGFDKREIPYSQRDGFATPLSHLMRAYGGRGYIRLFAEDVASSGTFLPGNGFAFGEPPAEYYPQPVMQAMEKDEKNASCQSLTSRSEALLRYVSDVFTPGNGRKKFGYLWLSQHTLGGDSAAVSYLDQPLKFFLRNLSESGALNDTAVFLLSNHGKTTRSNFSLAGVRATEAPFCFMVLPERFLRQHLDVAVALDVNQRRLVTPYDLHATLLSLALLPRLRFESTDKGSNLFKALSPNRSCGDAFVPPNMCGCLETQQQVVVDDSDQVRLASLAVDHMNEVTEINFPHRCARWQLDRVEEAEVLGGGAEVGRIDIRVRITTMQEVTFDVFGGIRMVGVPKHYLRYIERLSVDVQSADCMPDTALKVYCRCKPVAGGAKYGRDAPNATTKAP